MHANIPLSRLVANRFNPRRVKPQREAHRRLVASIRAYGLLEPLIVRQVENSEDYLVIAGSRRLAALREVFRGEDQKIACQVSKTGDPEAISLAENFAREPMHPLDEAESFARLIREEDKDVSNVAADFGVPPTYVRQRMKLSTLADPIKAAYRTDGIDTGTAKAFACVPEDKQLDVWKEVGGTPHSANQVRNIIANAWIDSKHALFDIATIPTEKVSSDLFGDRVLIERQAFLSAQSEAMIARQHILKEEGWSEVVIAPQGEIQDRLWRMDNAPVSYDDEITKKLTKLQDKREALDAKWSQIDKNDETAAEALQGKLDALDAQEIEITKDAVIHYDEAVKAVATTFMILDPDGRVRTEIRVLRPGKTESDAHDSAKQPLTSDDLSDKQKATLYAIQALAVRQAVLESSLTRKRLLVLILHDKVRREALSVRHEANATTIFAQRTEGFTCPALDDLRAKRAELDPLVNDVLIEDHAAYEKLCSLSEAQLDALIDLLAVEALSAHPVRPTEMVCLLTRELKVEIRAQWLPNSNWLSSYQKLQLADLWNALKSPAHTPSDGTKKKSELVEQLATLFGDAAHGKLTDLPLATRVNQWLPAKLLPEFTPKEVIASIVEIPQSQLSKSAPVIKGRAKKKKKVRGRS